MRKWVRIVEDGEEHMQNAEVTDEEKSWPKRMRDEGYF